MSSQSQEQTIDVAYVAELARLKPTPQEIERFSHQLGDILSYIKQLSQLHLNQSTAELSVSSDVQNALRSDSCQSSFSAEEALANAPLRNHDLFAVPRIIE